MGLDTPQEDYPLPVVVELKKGTVSGWQHVALSDGSFFMLPIDVLHEQGWSEYGRHVDPAEAAARQSAAMYQRTERKALESLSRAEQGRRRLEQKLIAKGCPANIVRDVLDSLQERNLLSDTRFAETWARQRLIRKGEGPRAVERGLMSRGISNRTAAQAVRSVLEDEPQLLAAALHKAVQRLSGRSSVKTRDQLIYQLRQEGFESELILAVV